MRIGPDVQPFSLSVRDSIVIMSVAGVWSAQAENKMVLGRSGSGSVPRLMAVGAGLDSIDLHGRTADGLILDEVVPFGDERLEPSGAAGMIVVHAGRAFRELSSFPRSLVRPLRFRYELDLDRWPDYAPGDKLEFIELMRRAAPWVTGVIVNGERVW